MDAWYELQRKLEQLINETLLDKVFAVKSRTKPIGSILEKVERKRQSKADYTNKDVTDIVGIRLIVLFSDDMEEVLDSVTSLFKVHSGYVAGEAKLAKQIVRDHPGALIDFYDRDETREGVHLVLSIGAGRENLPEWQGVADLRFELQLRTAMSDVWATMDHQLVYKSKNDSAELLKNALKDLSLKVDDASEPAKNVPVERVQSSISRFSEILDIFVELLEKPDVHEKRDLHPYLLENQFILHPSASEVFSEEAIGLGTQFRMDFVIREATGQYILVEIENSRHPIFTKAGDFSSAVGHAQRQVEDWQQWIEENLLLVRQRYPDMVAPMGMVVIGRKQGLSKEDRNRLARRNANMRGRMVIQTYDDLIAGAKNLIEIMRRGPSN